MLPGFYVSSRNGLRATCQIIRQTLPRSRRTVFGDVVQVIPADNDCPCHFGRDDFAREDAPTNRDIASKGAFLVYTCHV